MEDIKITRIPRLLGSTRLSLNYQKSGSDSDKEKIFKHIVTQYALQGFMYNNIPCSINQLSAILSIPNELIMQYITELSTSLGTFNSPDRIQDTLKSIATLSTTWAIQDRGTILNQLTLLLKSQRGKYMPFISSEVNKTLKLVLDSNRNLIETFRTLNNTTSTTNILNIFSKQQSDQDYMSPDQALEFLQQKGLPAPNTQLPLNSFSSQERQNQLADTKIMPQASLQALFSKYSLGDSPDCLEWRSGTEALTAQPHPGLTTPEPQSIGNELDGFEADTPTPSHLDFESRRGEPRFDDEEFE